MNNIERFTLEQKMKNVFAIGIVAIIVFVVIALCGGILCGTFYFVNKYWVWSAHMTGEQELARAEGNRKIAIVEANAKKESAKALAEAEIIRAEGVAKANQIIGNSLKNNESYLKYLWVQSLDHTQNKVIYIPTESNLPILEAIRLKKDE